MTKKVAKDTNITVNIMPVLDSIVGKNLCLNMIVKNESKIIRRLLESVSPYIDCYCICDTGSTDNTVEIIQSFFESQTPPIPGMIINEAFRDFGYNRSYALKACEQIDVKYVLLLDADMIFYVNPSISKNELHNRLTDDVYYIFQGSDNFYYKNVRIVKNKLGMSYWGVTHEYVRTPEGSKYGKLEKADVFINDIGDGGSKSDKFIRDINLLKKGLIDEPNNDRYTFYLANSYKDSGQYQNAIDTYKKRIEIGGWFDEVWYSHFNIGRCYKHLGDMVNAVHWWMEAYNFYPNRIENLYEIIHHYRSIGKNNLAYGFYLLAETERKKNTHSDYLFLQKDVYAYKLDYELSIIGYYCNFNNYNLKKCCMKVLNYPHVEENIAQNVLNNYKFYANELGKHNILSDQNQNTLKLIGQSLPEIQNSLDEFTSSTPSLTTNSNGDLIVNVRYVNYRINDKGGYENKGTIATKNVIAQFTLNESNEYELKKEFVIKYNEDYDNLYVGLEDVRLFTMKGSNDIYFNANRGLDYHNIVIEHGIIDMREGYGDTKSEFIKIENQRQVEKNWVLFENNQSQMKIIYNWSPLIIGNIVASQDQVVSNGTPPMIFEKTHEISSPYFFKHLRGSTNGVKIGNEIWFICHTVSYEDRRYYYHLFVVLDATSYKVKKYTSYFTFHKEKVEYTLGFIYNQKQDSFTIGYSIMDRETEYITVPKSTVDELMILNE